MDSNTVCVGCGCHDQDHLVGESHREAGTVHREETMSDTEYCQQCSSEYDPDDSDAAFKEDFCSIYCEEEANEEDEKGSTK